RVDRLQQIIDVMHLEGFQGVLVVSRREDHRRLVWKPVQQFEAGHAGHLNIEEESVDRFAGKELQGHCGICSTPGDDHGRLFAQQPFQALHRERFVIHQVDSQGHGHRCGKDIRVVKYSPLRTTSSRASPPNNSARRALRLSNPCPSGTESSKKPGPSSRTSRTARSASTAALTRISPPPGRCAIACLMLFSTRVSTESGGMRMFAISAGTSIEYRKRESNRVLSISR